MGPCVTTTGDHSAPDGGEGSEPQSSHPLLDVIKMEIENKAVTFYITAAVTAAEVTGAPSLVPTGVVLDGRLPLVTAILEGR